MKGFSILVTILFTINYLQAQNSNANWELKIIEIYSDGSRFCRPILPYHEIKTFKTQDELDSIEKLNRNIHKYNVERLIDSVEIERFKANNFNKGIELKAIEYWVKPKREIVSKDTFEITNIIGATFINITPAKSPGIVMQLDEKANNSGKLDYRIQYTNTEILKSKYADGYYFLGKYPILENSSFSLGYYSSDTAMEILHDWHCNIPNETPYIFAVLPNNFKWFNNILSKKASLEWKRSYFDTMPDFSWNSIGYKMEIDTMFTNRKIALDIVNGKKTYRIQKQYLERPKELIVDTRTNSILLILANMKDSAFFQYKFVPWEEYTGDNISWENGALSQNVIEIKDLPIGTYLLYIRDSISGKESQGYKITVLPRWYQTALFKILVGLLSLLCLLFLLFKIYHRKQKNKLLKVEEYKKTLDINLKSIRSQLNPHFIFNALNSIQSLITTTQYEKANEYLIEFSNLLRKPLNNEELKHWTLRDEIELLNSYIKIEQLRSPFKLDFSLDDRMNTEAINFPTLLIQPMVENAIKHALSQVEMPILRIKIVQEINNIVVLIQDNGKGFDSEKSNQGNGLKLTKEYINLINQKYKHSNVSLKLVSNEGGTTVYLKLENWIDE